MHKITEYTSYKLLNIIEFLPIPIAQVCKTLQYVIPICKKIKQFRAAILFVVTGVRLGEITGWYFEL
jgi:hypothetical protein